ncbi:MAG TPA: alpha/beta hydrolase [Euzebyales bacterium]|nr:alpha/beta hydrolase [Euzebyales bacterium]
MTAVAAAGTTFACLDRGEGPLTVLLHGFGMDRRMWRPVLEHLDGGRRYLAVDLRGAGDTAPHPGPEMTLERHADDVAAVIRGCGVRRACVVGFSMGAFVLLALLERHPRLVSSAVFVGARANADDAPTRAGRAALIRTLVDDGRGAGYRQILPKLAAPGATVHVRAQLRTMFEDQPYDGLVAAQEAMLARPDRRSVLAGVTVPVLVVAGEHDAFAPAPLPQQMAQAAPDGRLEVVAGVGHTIPLEAPAELAGLLDAFWRRSGR